MRKKTRMQTDGGITYFFIILLAVMALLSKAGPLEEFDWRDIKFQAPTFSAIKAVLP